MPVPRVDGGAPAAESGSSPLARIDLHCHSRYSASPNNWLAHGLGLRESYTDPHLVYRVAKSRGMTHVTLTDHDTLDGGLRLAHHDDFIIGEEVTSFFPSEAVQLHVLVWGIDERQHREMAELRFNVFELVDYLREGNLAHCLAHPFSLVTGTLRGDQVESLLLLFDLWETRNGLASRAENTLASDLVAHSGDLRARLSGKSPAAAEARPIGACAGSDDHSGLDAGTTFTLVDLDDDADTPLAALMRGRGRVRGAHGSTAKLAHTGVSLLLKGGENRGPLVRGALRQATRSDLFWELLERPRNRRLAARAASVIASAGWRRGGEPRSLAGTAVREASASFLGGATDAGIRHEQLEALADSTWRRAMHERLGDLAKVDFQSLAADADRLRRLFETQALLSPYLLASGYHARQRRNAATATAMLAARDLVPQPPATTMPRIAMFTDTYDEVNGVGSVLRELVQHAVGNDWPFTLVSAGPGRSSQPCRDIFAAVESTFLDVYRGFPFALLPILEVLRWCEAADVEVIHAATPGPVGLVAWLVASSLDVPFVATYHTDLPQLGFSLTGDHLLRESLWAYVRLFYDQCEVVFCPSDSTRRSLVEHRVRSRFEPFEQAVDCSLFTPARRDDELRQTLGGGRQILLWVGRISPEKGLDTLAGAVATLRARRDDVQLVIVGEGPGEVSLREQAGDAIFLGVKRGEELAAIYASADIFVFPGNAETFGQVVLEAAAAGLPAVVSAGSGVDEAVVRDVTALTVAPGDQRGFLAALERLLDDRELAARMGAAAREFAAARTWPTTFERLAHTYRSLTEQGGAAP